MYKLQITIRRQRDMFFNLRIFSRSFFYNGVFKVDLNNSYYETRNGWSMGDY